MTMSDDDFVKRLREKLASMPEEPAPPRAMKRWSDALEDAARSARPARASALDLRLRFAAAASIVAAVVGVAFVAYRETGIAPLPGSVAGVRIERTMQLHLIDLESQLARVADLSIGDRAGALRHLAEQNRLQTAVAERAGGSREARVLRAFTVTLEDMAADPDPNGRFKAALAQLDFELRVTQARLASSSPSTSALRSQAL